MSSGTPRPSVEEGCRGKGSAETNRSCPVCRLERIKASIRSPCTHTHTHTQLAAPRRASCPPHSGNLAFLLTPPRESQLNLAPLLSGAPHLGPWPPSHWGLLGGTWSGSPRWHKEECASVILSSLPDPSPVQNWIKNKNTSCVCFNQLQDMGAFKGKESRPELAPGQAGRVVMPSWGQEHAEQRVHPQVRSWGR